MVFGKAKAGRNRASQRGLTLIELLVALAISSIVAIAAVSALIVSRQGFSTVDAASQLRDSGRFASDLIQRLIVQSGYQDAKILTNPSTTHPANIGGFNNSTSSATDPLNTATARSAGTTGYGSDVLILRYQAAETFPGSGVADSTMIDCAGNPSTTVPADETDRVMSVFHVGIDSQGEPSLMCTTGNPTTGTFTVQPVIRGVENFQVLYGVDGVVPNTAPTGTPDAVADRFLRADQMPVAGDATATENNWRRVRSIRIGMVIRGPVGSSQEKISRTFYPLGQAAASATGTAGSALSSSNDPGTVFASPVDSRMRQTLTFTVHLRNAQ